MWSENEIILDAFKIEFHGTALDLCQENEIVPPNLENVLFYLMRNLALNSKQESDSENHK